MTPLPSSSTICAFRRRLIAWQKQHGRHDLPWQNTRDAYRIWVSEIMLQQTQVSTVIPKYAAFMRRFPSVRKLAAAPLDDVMALWAGLGYYARARNMHRAAQEVAASFNGRMPQDAETLQTLPGIGRSTAAAIAVFSSGERAAILDGNVKRVLSRVFLLNPSASAAQTDERLWALVSRLLPVKSIETYTQGLMDLGATVCKPRNPNCALCPLAALCGAHKEGRIAEFPVRRSARVRPVKSWQLVIVSHHEKVLVERRPPKGIWGGLWCFPEVGTEMDVQSAMRTHYGIACTKGRPGAPLRHEFTHFSLDILPVRVKLAGRDAFAVFQEGRLWASREDFANFGVPAPVSVLLDRHWVHLDEQRRVKASRLSASHVSNGMIAAE